MKPHDDVGEFVSALAHQERAELGAALFVGPGVTEIRYREPLEWPWPRRFAYRREFFVNGLSTTQAMAVLDAADATGGEYVVDFFHADLVRETEAMVAAGHVLAWTSPVMSRDLAVSRPGSAVAAAFAVEAVSTDAQLQRYRSLPGISNPLAPADAHIHRFMIERRGETVAKGQLVYLGGTAAYVSDMFTLPAQRRTGLCTAIMAALEATAQALGASRACLAPGRDAAAIKLYDGFGYTVCAQRGVLIPAAARPRS